MYRYIPCGSTGLNATFLMGQPLCLYIPDGSAGNISTFPVSQAVISLHPQWVSRLYRYIPSGQPVVSLNSRWVSRLHRYISSGSAGYIATFSVSQPVSRWVSRLGVDLTKRHSGRPALTSKADDRFQRQHHCSRECCCGLGSTRSQVEHDQETNAGDCYN